MILTSHHERKRNAPKSRLKCGTKTKNTPPKKHKSKTILISILSHNYHVPINENHVLITNLHERIPQIAISLEF